MVIPFAKDLESFFTLGLITSRLTIVSTVFENIQIYSRCSSRYALYAMLYTLLSTHKPASYISPCSPNTPWWS